MEIIRQPSGKTLTLILTGRLDGSWSEHTSDLLNTTLSEGWHHLRLDLAQVSFLSSAGIRTLMLHYKRLTELQGTFVITAPSKQVRDILEMAGLHSLLMEPLENASSTLQPPSTAFPGGTFETYALRSDTSFTSALLTPGNTIRCSEETLSLGIGSLGSESLLPGEFLALGGTAIAQPADGQQSVDYLATQGNLQPYVTPLSGITAQGTYTHCLRFESNDPHRGLALSSLIDVALSVTQSEAVGIAFAVETEFLVGAALLSPSGDAPITLAPFPEIRDQMLFTSEPAWPRSLSLGVTFASRTQEHRIASQLRPLHPSSNGSSLYAHTHAVAFPYRPLAKGQIELRPTVDLLLQTERPLGLLHLLNDHRPGGLGESRFYRGAIWTAPLS